MICRDSADRWSQEILQQQAFRHGAWLRRTRGGSRGSAFARSGSIPMSLANCRHSLRSALRQQRASSSISSSCPCSYRRCTERSSRSCMPRSGRTWRAALHSLLPRAGMTASLDLTDSLCRAWKVASALRDRGNIWQGCHIAILLSEDEYVPRPLIHVRHITAQLAPKEAPHSSVAGWPWPS